MLLHKRNKLAFKLTNSDYYRIECDEFRWCLFPHDKLLKTPVLGIFLLVVRKCTNYVPGRLVYDALYDGDLIKYVRENCVPINKQD